MNKVRWVVETDWGTVTTFAASRGRAERNARFKLVMRNRIYSRPNLGDLAQMRDMTVYSCKVEDARA